MRFYNYINEDEKGLEKWKSLIKEKCKPYLKLVKGSDRLLFSGRRNEKPFIRKQVRQNRKPVDTPLEVHELIDNQFKDKFGIRARSNSIFCYFKNINMGGGDSSAYGDPYYIFPIGDYTTIWAVRIDDLYEWLKDEIGEHTSRRSEFYHMDGDDIIDNWRNINDKEELLDIIEDMDIPNYYSIRDYQKLSKDTNEIMLHCKEYIGIGHAFVHSNFKSIWELING